MESGNDGGETQRDDLLLKKLEQSVDAISNFRSFPARGSKHHHHSIGNRNISLLFPLPFSVYANAIITRHETRK